jgi:hypothetical protein
LALAVDSKKIQKGPAFEETMIPALTQLSGLPLLAIPMEIEDASKGVVPGSSAKADSASRREGRNDIE